MYKHLLYFTWELQTKMVVPIINNHNTSNGNKTFIPLNAEDLYK